MKDWSKEECETEIMRFNEKFWEHWIHGRFENKLSSEMSVLWSVLLAIHGSVREEYLSSAISFLVRTYENTSQGLADFVEKKKNDGVDYIYARDARRAAREAFEKATEVEEERIKKEMEREVRKTKRTNLQRQIRQARA